MKKVKLLFALLVYYQIAFAQKAYPGVDAKVAAFGPLMSFNVATIADTITTAFADNEMKARAIFYWIANNIAIDPKGSRQNDEKNNMPENVIARRLATPLGFSLLVQEMCSDVNIRCISVDGFTKYSFEDINDPATDKNHSWNVIQLGKSPETWYFADACRASGYLDKKMTVFTKQFSPGFFFTDRKLFNLINFPDNPAWELGGTIRSLKDFYAMPVIGNYAADLDLTRLSPLTGYIKTNTKKPIAFSFYTDSVIKEITFVTGEGKKQSAPITVKFENNSGVVTFSYQFKKEDSFPLKIFADGKQLLEYSLEVSD